MASQEYDPNSLPDLLPLYYKRLFPYGPYWKWLTYGGIPKHYFSHREFSFTLKDDVYIRYQSFLDQQDFEKELQKKCPFKIDIGAVYSHRPKDHKTVKSTAFLAQEKELVFDIDMTDYDDVRSCCTFMWFSLTDDFGFEHLLWVYSGRRGIHCWVCDELARTLSPQGRSAIAEYLTLVKGGENQIRKVNLPDKLHPSIRHAIKIIDQHFVDYIVKKQDLLDCEEKWKPVIALVPAETGSMRRADEITCTHQVQQHLSSDFSGKLGKDTRSRWKILTMRLAEAAKADMIKGHAEAEIKLQLCYPRLDVNVSKGINHLLKSPFCIHPKTVTPKKSLWNVKIMNSTGRVCVPMDPNTIDDFDPLAVPTISGLLDELNKVEPSEKDEQGKKLKDYKKTSLGPYVHIFETFLRGLEASRKGKLIEQSDMKMEF